MILYGDGYYVEIFAGRAGVQRRKNSAALLRRGGAADGVGRGRI